MPDIMIRHIDRLMVERIKTLAKERQWSVHDVVMQALRRGLGVSESAGVLAESLRDAKELAPLAEAWDAHEQAAFQEAMQALVIARPEQLAAENR